MEKETTAKRTMKDSVFCDTLHFAKLQIQSLRNTEEPKMLSRKL